MSEKKSFLLQLDENNESHKKAILNIERIPEGKQTDWIVSAINHFAAGSSIEAIIASMLDERLEKHHVKIETLIEKKARLIGNTTENHPFVAEEIVTLQGDACKKLPDNALDFLDNL
jgi:hypothetical protein